MRNWCYLTYEGSYLETIAQIPNWAIGTTKCYGLLKKD